MRLDRFVTDVRLQMDAMDSGRNLWRKVPIATIATLLAVVALAGCFGGEELVESDLGLGGEGGQGEDGEFAAELPEGALREAVDPWGEDETERVLLDATVQAGQCYDLATAWELMFGLNVMGGCAFIELDEGVLIPEGSKELRIEADASEALHSGGYISFFYTMVRDHYTKANGEQSFDPVHTWVFPLDPLEWDPLEAPYTGAWMGFWTGWEDTDPPPVFDGPVQVRVIVEKDPAFEPQPLLDLFYDIDPARSPQEGVMTIMDETVRMENYGGFPVGNSIPANASTLAVGVQWDEVTNCPPGHECPPFFGLVSHGHWTGMYDLDESRLIEGDRWYVMLFDIPDQAMPDNQYSDGTGTRIDAWINRCPAPPTPILICHGVTPESSTINVRFLVEAWQDDVDVEAVKERLGAP